MNYSNLQWQTQLPFNVSGVWLNYVNRLDESADKVSKRFTANDYNVINIDNRAFENLIKEASQNHYELSELIKTTRVEVKAVLNSVSTDTKLYELWPDASDIIQAALGTPKLHNDKALVTQIDTLNKTLGLP